jgi:hypothetical protein
VLAILELVGSLELHSLPTARILTLMIADLGVVKEKARFGRRGAKRQ